MNKTYLLLHLLILYLNQSIYIVSMNTEPSFLDPKPKYLQRMQIKMN